MHIYSQVFTKNGTELLKRDTAIFFMSKVGTEPLNRKSWQLCSSDSDAIHANLSARLI